jgi:uncharacterized membrane protein YheB (UPF0754 family)
MNYIIPVITGALIGYFTNWLAIKMLFRPLKEKRLLGMKVPFTPGLIPKESKRIARSVGNTIGQHLLSPEVLSQALCSERIISYIRENINEGLEKLRGSSTTIEDYMKRIFGESFKQVEASLKSGITEKLAHYLEDRENRKAIVGALGSFINKSYYDEKSEEYLNMKQFAGKSIRAYTETKEFRDYLNNLFERTLRGAEKSQLTIAQALPEELFRGIEDYIYEHEEELAHAIKKGVTTFPVRAKLKKAVVSMLEQNLGRIISMFASLDSISEKVIKGVEEYLSKPENYREIADTTIKLMGNIAGVKISSLSASIAQTGVNSFEMLSEAALTALWEREGEKQLTSDEDNRNAPGGILELGVKLSDGLAEYGYIRKASEVIADKGLSLVWGIEVSQLASIIEPGMAESLSMGFESIYTNLVKNRAPQVLETMNIPEIVEDEINGFDIEFTEKLITDIAQKELSAITWLGALLGAVMGIVIPMLENLF